MKASEIILKLKQETGRITNNPLLDRVDLDILKRFETRAENNNDYKRKLKQIASLASGLTYLYDKKYQYFFDIYNELVVFELLSTKLEAKFIVENGDTKTPDYKLSLNDTDFIYADLKTLHFVDGNLNYIDIQNQGAASKIALEKEMKTVKKRVYFSEPVFISPFRRGNTTAHQDYRTI